MSTYTVWLIDLLPTGIEVYRNFNRDLVRTTLEGLFNDVISFARIPQNQPSGSHFVLAPQSNPGFGTFDRARVVLRTDCPTPNPWELMIYLVTEPGSSLIAVRTGTQVSTQLGHLGMTYPIQVSSGQPALSEVYVGGALAPAAGGRTRYMTSVRPTPVLVAKTAFHEAMHNKVTRNVHGLGGGGISSAVITDSTPLTNIDKRAMAEVLGRDRSQWTQGCRDYWGVIVPRQQQDRNIL